MTAGAGTGSRTRGDDLPEPEPRVEPEPEPEPDLQLQPNGRVRPPGTNGKSGRASQPKGTPGPWSDAKRKSTPGPAATSSKKNVRARSERGSSLRRAAGATSRQMSASCNRRRGRFGDTDALPLRDLRQPATPLIFAGAATLATAALGAGLGLASKPGFFALAGAAGLVFLAIAIAAPRLAFVAALFALAGYLPDTLLHSGMISQLLLVVVLAAVLIRRAVHVESLETPRVLWGFLALLAAYVISTLPVADVPTAFAKIVDLAGFTLLVMLTVLLVDSERWLRRAMWAVAGSVGLLAVLAVAQRELNLSEVAFGGLATMMQDAGIERSGGPLSFNFFGQVVAAGAILAVYLGLAAASVTERAVAICVFIACALALIDTGSRGALIAFAVTVFLVGVLRHVRIPDPSCRGRAHTRVRQRTGAAGSKGACCVGCHARGWPDSDGPLLHGPSEREHRGAAHVADAPLDRCRSR